MATWHKLDPANLAPIALPRLMIFTKPPKLSAPISLFWLTLTSGSHVAVELINQKQLTAPAPALSALLTSVSSPQRAFTLPFVVRYAHKTKL